MRRKSALGAMLVGVVAFLGALGARAFGRRHVGAGDGPSMMMSDGSMQQQMQVMMAPSNREPMRTGMALFRAHADVRRSVTRLPNGIRATSVSDDPHVAALLQEHVSQMYARLASANEFPYPMSRSVPKLFAHSTGYRRELTLITRGIQVTETSDDPAIVAIIHDHAREIDGFVKDGMPRMMGSMMM